MEEKPSIELPKHKIYNSGFICKVCGLKHTKIKECEYYCDKCNLQFTNCAHKMYYHEKEFYCCACKKNHELIRENFILKYKCKDKLENLSEPFRQCHGSDRYNSCEKEGKHDCLFWCSICRCIIGTKITITQHRKKCKIICDKCHKNFRSISELNLHICEKLIHKCKTCDLRMNYRDFIEHNCEVFYI